MTIRFCVLASAVLATCGTAAGALVSFDFSAKVSGGTGTLNSTVLPIGTLASLHLEYDPSTAATASDPYGNPVSVLDGLISVSFANGMGASTHNPLMYSVSPQIFTLATPLWENNVTGDSALGVPPSLLVVSFLWVHTFDSMPSPPYPFSPPVIPTSLDFDQLFGRAVVGYTPRTDTNPVVFLQLLDPRLPPPPPVPEPSAGWLALAGLACLPLARRFGSKLPKRGSSHTRLLIALAVVAAASRPATAALISFDFAAVTIAGGGASTFPVGSPVTVHIEYDPATDGRISHARPGGGITVATTSR